MNFLKLCFFINLLIFNYNVSAGTITNTGLPGGLQVNYFEPIGQSFTAIDANVEAGLDFWVQNPQSSNNNPLRYSLYEGEGIAGSVLALSTFSLADDFSGLHMVDFSFIDLTIGGLYTLMVEVVGDSAYWGLHTGTALAGGVEFRTFNGTTSKKSSEDLHINVTGVSPPPSAVPIPAAAFMFAPAVLGFLGLRRKAKNSVA